MTRLSTMAAGNVQIHAQLPPLLTPLRDILNMILDGTMTQPSWASLEAVVDALKRVIGPCNVHLAGDGGQTGGHAAETLQSSPSAAYHGDEAWQADLGTLRSLLGNANSWPVQAVPVLQEAAMQPVRGIARRTPEDMHEQPLTGGMPIGIMEWGTSAASQGLRRPVVGGLVDSGQAPRHAPQRRATADAECWRPSRPELQSEWKKLLRRGDPMLRTGLPLSVFI